MFTEQQLAAFKAMNHEQIQKRFKEIQDEVNKNDPNTNLEMLRRNLISYKSVTKSYKVRLHNVKRS